MDVPAGVSGESYRDRPCEIVMGLAFDPDGCQNGHTLGTITTVAMPTTMLSGVPNRM